MSAASAGRAAPMKASIAMAQAPVAFIHAPLLLARSSHEARMNGTDRRVRHVSHALSGKPPCYDLMIPLALPPHRRDPMNLQLSIGITNNPRTWPILDGTVKPEGIDLIPTILHPSELFWRQLHFAEFAVSEMSCSSFLIAVARNDTRFVGLPIFTTRRFFHPGILVRRGAGIDKPADLKGKRVGVPEYQQTAALWARGVLEHEFGVAPKDMEFWMERTPEMSHGGATGFKPPPGVTVHQIPADKSIGSMMLAGELDAVIFYLVDPNLIDRSTVDLRNHPDIKPLFP